MPTQSFGVPPNTWTYSKEAGYDLSRGADSERAKTLATHKGPVKIDPKRSALVVIDNQNFFLHPGFRTHAPGLAAKDLLVKYGIPASRSAGVKVLWVNWGLTDDEIANMPPSQAATFGAITTGDKSVGDFGCEEGIVAGVNAGRRLVRGSWNAELYGELQGMYEEGEKAGTDVWIHKNRMSGLWGPGTPLETYLRENKIESLFFAGVNADQCVWGTLIDGHNKGFDTFYVKDLSATTSPKACTEATEYNTSSFGFLLTAEEYAKGLLA
ncbi:hypothetical protein RQP46_005364 [Phenoliferia psychrophenolica]